jgi:hypothetical protein
MCSTKKLIYNPKGHKQDSQIRLRSAMHEGGEPLVLIM